MFLKFLSSFCFIAPTLIGVSLYKRLPFELKIFLSVNAINGILDGFTFWQYIAGYNSSELLNLYIVPYLLLYTFPVLKVINSRLIRFGVIFPTVLAVAWISLQIFQIDISSTFYSNGISIIGVNLIVSYLIYLFYVALISKKLTLRGHPLFFIASTFIIYQAFNTSIFVFMNILDGDALSFLWKFRYISNIVLNAVISAAFIFYGRTWK